MNKTEEVSRERANAFRAEHQLGFAPVGDLFELVHVAFGLDVFAMNASEAEHGLTMCDPLTETIVIVVATTPHPMRQRSTIAHELGHVVAGDIRPGKHFQPGSQTSAETHATTFARHLLVPLESVERHVPTGATVTEQVVSELVQEFGASPQIVTLQLKLAARLSAAECEQLVGLRTPELAARYGWAGQYRQLAEASQRQRAPQDLVRRSIAGYEAGFLGFAEIAEWYDGDLDELKNIIGEPGSVPLHAPEELTWDEPLFPDGFPAAE